jgi:hypothetical protein
MAPVKWQHSSKTPTYKSWVNMHTRCTNPSHENHERYKTAGITVCERWDSYDAFYEDMGERPEGMTLDRIDNDKGYEPGNCRWATPRQQSRNTRFNTMVTYKGKTQCIAAWAEELGLSRITISGRLFRGEAGEYVLRPVRGDDQ